MINDALAYVVKFRNGVHQNKIYGPGWEKLVRDYPVHARDVIIVKLDGNDLFFQTLLSKNIDHGGGRLEPLPSVGKLSFLVVPILHLILFCYCAIYMRLVLQCCDFHFYYYYSCFFFFSLYAIMH